MSTTDFMTKLRGYVEALPASQPCRVALIDGETEYPVLPRGAGIDLADMVSAHLEVVCSIHETDEVKQLHVRSYTVLDAPDESSWFGDEA